MRKSAVWKFFERILEDGSEGRCVAVECKLCAKTIKFFGNTTNLKVHLTSRHPIQWELSENGTLDQTTAIQFEDESSLLLDVPTKQAYKNVQSDNEHQDDDDAADFVERITTNDEEWLEESPEIEYVHPRKRKRVTVKHEVESPPNSRHLSYLYTKEPNHMTEPVNSFPTEPPKDEYSVFGEYIASKLRKIEQARTRGNVQQLITTILWQAEYGKYNDSDSVKKIIKFTNDEPFAIVESKTNPENQSS